MTTFLVVQNDAVSTLASGVDDAVTTWTVATGEGALFPSTYPFHVSCEDEIASCTSRATDALTVVRAQQGTVAIAHAADVEVELRVTAKSVTDLNAAVNTLEDHQIVATEVEVSEIGEATYDDVQDFINNTMSAGIISGGTISAHGDADGKVLVAAGTGFIKTTNSAIGVTPSFDWDETTLSTTDIPDLDVSYIYVDYTAGSPVPKATTDRTTIELNRMFTLGRVYRSGTTLHIINSGTNLSNHIRVNHERLIGVRGFERASGGVIAETGTRYLTSTAGKFYLGANPVTTAQQDTSGNGHTLTRWYHTGGNWVVDTDGEGASAAGQISNEHYDDGTNIADIGTARYGVFWMFIHMDGDLQVVYGRGSYKLAEAEAAIVPTLPDAVSEFAILAAKIIVAQGGTNFTSIVTAYETLFPISSPPNHWDLGGLQGGTTDEYYHLTSAEHTEFQTGYVLKSLFDAANTILKADVQATPEGLTIAEQRLVGRITDGVITGLTGAQVMALLSGQAGAAFGLNSQNLVGVSEMRLVPKASSSGAEGTIFYDSDDDHVYVGTE